MSNPEAEALSLILAVDLGGTDTKVALVDSLGRIVVRETLRTTDFPKAELLVAALADVLVRLEVAAGGRAVAVGLGAPNGHHGRGTVEHAPNLSWKDKVPLREMLAKATGLPVELDNDANLAALGQGRFGACRGMDDFVVVTLGTGLGGGIVAGGQLLRGASGFAGELGHVLSERDGRLCGCGRRGCLETYVSARGLVASYGECLRKSQIQPREGEVAQAQTALTAAEVHAKALEGDAAALEAFAITAARLAGALVDLTLLLGPECVAFTGGLTASGETLLGPTREAYLAQLPEGTPAAKLVFSTTPDATLAGAVALVHAV